MQRCRARLDRQPDDAAVVVRIAELLIRGAGKDLLALLKGQSAIGQQHEPDRVGRRFKPRRKRERRAEITGAGGRFDRIEHRLELLARGTRREHYLWLTV